MTQIEKVQMGNWELKYYVRELEEVFGVRIERHGAGEVISEETCGITASYEEAQRWVRKMAEGGVTPLTLHAIVDDMVG